MEAKEYLFSVTACNKCGPGEPAYIDEPVNISSPASKYLSHFSAHILLYRRQKCGQVSYLRFHQTQSLAPMLSILSAVPDPPENLKWRDKCAKSIFLLWEPPKYDGGSPVKGYVVDKCQRGTDKWEPCGDPLPELK